MATPFYGSMFIEYEDAKGNLTGDQDVFVWYFTDAAGKCTLNTSAGNSFVFTRGPARITDFALQASATMIKTQLVINNLARNVYWVNAAQLTTAFRKPTNIRIAPGSQIELIQS